MTHRVLAVECIALFAIFNFMKPEEDKENPSEVTRLLMSLQPCVACDGRGTVGEMGSYDRPIRVTCSHCFGTGKEGGDHICFANAQAEP